MIKNCCNKCDKKCTKKGATGATGATGAVGSIQNIFYGITLSGSQDMPNDTLLQASFDFVITNSSLFGNIFVAPVAARYQFFYNVRIIVLNLGVGASLQVVAGFAINSAVNVNTLSTDVRTNNGNSITSYDVSLSNNLIIDLQQNDTVEVILNREVSLPGIEIVRAGFRNFSGYRLP